MPFAREEETFAEAAGEVRLERGDLRLVRALVAVRALSEAVDLARVARRRDDQRAFALHARNARVPPVDRALAHRDDGRGRALALAKRREHSPGQPRRVAAEIMRALDQRHLRAALGERKRAGQADDARADDERAAHRCLVSEGVEAQALLRPSQ